MKFLSKFFRTPSRDRDIRRVQRIISPPGFDPVRDFRKELQPNRQKAISSAWEEYLSLCEADQGVKRLIQEHHLSRDDLQALTNEYRFSGLGGWVNGHETALSTIAYEEPLQFALKANNNGISNAEVAWQLMTYWKQNAPKGYLLQNLNHS